MGTGELLADSLAEPPADPDDWQDGEDRSGQVLGAYRLVRQLGIGGMARSTLRSATTSSSRQQVASSSYARAISARTSAAG